MPPKLRKKLDKYGPRLGVLAIVLFVVISSGIVAIQQREEYRRDTFDVYLAETAKERAARQALPKVFPAVDEEAYSLYAAPSGKRYHYDPQCPGRNSREITWADVERRGLTPCKKCVK